MKTSLHRLRLVFFCAGIAVSFAGQGTSIITRNKWFDATLVAGEDSRKLLLVFNNACSPAVTSSIIEPVNGTVDHPYAMLKILVGEAEGAKRYTLELNSKADFSGQSWIMNSVADDQRVFIFKNLAPQTTYYGRVRTDVSSYGMTTSFTTRAPQMAKRLWGVTTAGGANGLGTIFSYSVDSLLFRKHHDYQNENGANLHGGLVYSTSGKLYGTSVYTGTGFGEVFSLSPRGDFALVDHDGPHQGSVMLASNNFLYIVDDWINEFRGGIYRIYEEGDNVSPVDRIVYSFKAAEEGTNPGASLIEMSNEYLYGTAPYGGMNNNGVIYRVRLDGGNFQVLHSFNGTSGAKPNASITDGQDGYVYGMAPYGGSGGAGVIFRMYADGSLYTKLYDFGGEGAYPFGGLVLYNGSLYGMTSAGGAFDKGIIFRINMDGTGFTKLVDFNGALGEKPMGALVAGEDGTLWGMTSKGGDYGQGVMFRLQANGSGFEVLHNFSTTTGGMPNGSLLLLDDSFVPAASTSITADVSVHPNPFHGNFVTLSTPETETVKLSLMNTSGSVVRELTTLTNSPVSWGDDLDQGVYILKVVRSQEVSVHRLVKK